MKRIRAIVLALAVLVGLAASAAQALPPNPGCGPFWAPYGPNCIIICWPVESPNGGGCAFHCEIHCN